MITIHAWDKAGKILQQLDAAVLRQPGPHFRGPDQVAWIDLLQPTEEEEELVYRQFFPIHSLSLEDITRLRREPEAQPHFPKVEEFPDYLFVIVNPLTDEFLQHVRQSPLDHRPGATSFTQLSAILTANVLITHHYEPLSCVAGLKQSLLRHQSQADRGPDHLFHLILDATVDQYAPVLDYLDDALDGLEAEVVQRPQQIFFLRLLRLKREIILLRKTLIYEREVLVRLARGEFDLVDEREAVYYRNVYDHLVRFTELIESSRELVSDLMQSYLAAISNKLNEIMKVLTMISTTVLPMTLIAGIYGMNFTHMPEIEWRWGYPFAMGLMVATAVGSIGYFWWKKWF